MCMMILDYSAIGDRIRSRRKLLHKTQERLAEQIGVSVSFIGHIERGEKKASVETFARLAVALETTLDNLILGRVFDCDHQSCQLLSDIENTLAAYRLKR